MMIGQTKYLRRILFFVLLLITAFGITNAQDKEKKVRISPMAEVKQTVGFTDVEIIYSRPGVKGRTIWGALVPYNIVWRAGANEATKFIFSSDVFIEGKKLKAGAYSFFALPGRNEWSLIFNKVADQWGAFEYNESQDAIRIKVKPQKNTPTEWLTFTITKTSEFNAEVTLLWEMLKLEFEVKAPAN
ncbi:MAG: DUF2911 domain-containing protein [Ignavibacteriaceae bacterium]|nr:DUF2911 domain-containing protein [Ignavibacteriaceae bacterium]